MVDLTAFIATPDGELRPRIITLPPSCGGWLIERTPTWDLKLARNRVVRLARLFQREINGKCRDLVLADLDRAVLFAMRRAVKAEVRSRLRRR